MTDFVIHNGNQYEIKKLVMIRGEGGKASVKLLQLKNLEAAAASNQTDKPIVIPFDDGFHVLLKPIDEIKDGVVVYIVSKVLLKKIKYDPNPVVFKEPTREPDRFQRPYNDNRYQRDGRPPQRPRQQNSQDRNQPRTWSS